MSDEYVPESDQRDAAMKGAGAESLLALTRLNAANAKVLDALKARERGEASDIIGPTLLAIEATIEARRAIKFESDSIDDATR